MMHKHVDKPEACVVRGGEWTGRKPGERIHILLIILWSVAQNKKGGNC